MRHPGIGGGRDWLVFVSNLSSAKAEVTVHWPAEPIAVSDAVSEQPVACENGKITLFLASCRSGIFLVRER